MGRVRGPRRRCLRQSPLSHPAEVVTIPLRLCASASKPEIRETANRDESHFRSAALIAATRRLHAGAAAGSTSATCSPVDVVELAATDARDRMAAGTLTSHQLTQAYLDRIAKIDDAGPTLGAVIETNPTAIADADALDAERKAGKTRGPLHGIPVLLKDNIDASGMVNSAGSLALAENRPKQDAFVVARLRAAGAVILGKTNLSEWANFRSTRSTSGWSSRGGQTKNPYVLDRNPCGSSSGTGTAIAASLAAIGVGHRDRWQHHLPLSGGRARGPEANGGSRQPPRHHSYFDFSGHGRSDGAQRERRRAAPERPRGRGRSGSRGPRGSGHIPADYTAFLKRRRA